MTKEFIPYEQALDLKELGFDEPCFGFYRSSEDILPTIELITRISSIKNLNNRGMRVEILAPTYSQAFRWFRENYQMVFCYEPCLKKDLTYIFFIYMETTGEKVFVVESEYNEEAELTCLIKLIEIVKSKQCSKNGIKKEGESCTLNNNCIYPKCMK